MLQGQQLTSEQFAGMTSTLHFTFQLPVMAVCFRPQDWHRHRDVAMCNSAMNARLGNEAVGDKIKFTFLSTMNIGCYIDT